MLELEHVAVDHGSQRALWDVSLQVRERELVGLLGANGAGKSTTLGAIIGLYPTASGSLRYAGEAIGGRSTSRNVAAGIALVPEGRRLFPAMTVEENLAMGAYAPTARRGVREALARTYELFPILADKRRQDAGELSGGQQQMVAIAQALVLRPRFLVIDELSFGLAPTIVARLVPVIRQIAAQGIGVLLIEQFTHLALALADHVYVMSRGHVSYDGAPDRLRADSGILHRAYFPVSDREAVGLA